MRSWKWELKEFESKFQQDHTSHFSPLISQSDNEVLRKKTAKAPMVLGLMDY